MSSTRMRKATNSGKATLWEFEGWMRLRACSSRSQAALASAISLLDNDGAGPDVATSGEVARSTDTALA